MVALVAAFAALYTVGALVTFWYLTPTGASASFFPPAGLTLAVLLIAPRRTWPVWLATIAVTEITIDLSRHNSVFMAIGFATANVVEPLIGASLLVWIRRRGPGTETRALVTYVACAVVAGPFVGGLIGAAVTAMAGAGGHMSTWGQWWLGDALGVLVVATPILAFAQRRHNELNPPPWELVVTACAALVVAIVPPLYLHQSFAYAVLPVLIIAALRGGPLGVGVSGLGVGFGTSWVGATGHSAMLTTRHGEAAVMRAQLFIAVTILAALTLAVEVVQRIRVERRLMKAETQRIKAEIGAMEAAATERGRIARETHDILGHALNVMILSGAAARQVVDDDTTQAKELLATIEDVGREAFRDLDVALGLTDRSPDVSSLKGLADLDELVGRLARAGMQVDYSVHGPARPLPKLVDGSAYRIIQESLTNIAKHATNARGHVDVRFAPTALLLEVTDGSNGHESSNGADRARSNGKSVAARGLMGMRERVAVLGGHLEAGPMAGGGYSVTAELPLEPI